MLTDEMGGYFKRGEKFRLFGAILVYFQRFKMNY